MSAFLILGTRPQIIKSSPVINEAIRQGLSIKIVHTGQHYDNALSKIIFDELSSSDLFANLNVGSGSQIYQITETMSRLEKLFQSEKPSLIIIPGDTNSALAGGLFAAKMDLPVAHLESGARSYDMHMSEEINRRLIDHLSKVLFSPTDNCSLNLRNECVQGEVFQAGDTMFDVFSTTKDAVDKSCVINDLGFVDKDFMVLTAHRAENVDNKTKLLGLFSVLKNSNMPVLFPVHPRTKARLNLIGISFKNSNIHTIDPVGYIEMLSLLKHAKIAITDSGGLQKEALWSKTPCVTIRDRTEWVETVELGVNFVTDVNSDKITSALRYILDNYDEVCNRFTSNPYGDGRASERIVRFLKERL